METLQWKYLASIVRAYPTIRAESVSTLRVITNAQVAICLGPDWELLSDPTSNNSPPMLKYTDQNNRGIVIHLYDAVITISIVLSKIADNPPVSIQLFDSYLDFFTESLARIGINLVQHPVDALYKDADTNIRYAAMLYYTNPENGCMDKIDLHEITKLTRVPATARHTDSFLYLEDVVHIKTSNKKVKYDCDGLHLTESRAWISELTREDFVSQYKYFRQVLYRYYQVMSKK